MRYSISMQGQANYIMMPHRTLMDESFQSSEDNELFGKSQPIRSPDVTHKYPWRNYITFAPKKLEIITNPDHILAIACSRSLYKKGKSMLTKYCAQSKEPMIAVIDQCMGRLSVYVSSCQFVDRTGVNSWICWGWAWLCSRASLLRQLPPPHLHTPRRFPRHFPPLAANKCHWKNTLVRFALACELINMGLFLLPGRSTWQFIGWW